jgi:heme/copper-type cytochrome/quinol oxidase subunit 4
MRRSAARRRQTGQATTEFVLLVALIAVPVWMAVRALMQVVLRDFIITLIARFTQG